MPTVAPARPVSRRLPGIRFDAVPPAPPEVLPRMDIAGFVGFAASGPIDVPVPVEDPARFAEIFGSEAPIAWDPARSEPAYAQLGPAVRAFFRNGGRRCWVVRVAGAGAQADTFPLAGVAAVGADGTVGPATLAARARGSWADGLEVSTGVVSEPLAVQWSPARPHAVRVALAGGTSIAAGDLLRLSFPATTLMLVAGPVAAVPDGGGPHAVDVVAGAQRWITPVVIPAGSAVRVRHLSLDGGDVQAVARSEEASPPDGLTRLEFDPPASAVPLAGALVGAEVDGVVLVLDVAQVQATSAGVTALLCRAARVDAQPPPEPGLPDPFAARLTLRLAVDGGPGGQAALEGLGLAPAHPLYVGALPTDEALFGSAPPGAGPTAEMAAAVTTPRFPLAGPLLDPWAGLGGQVACCFPLPGAPSPSAGLSACRGTATTRVRDGLVRFGTEPFLDPALAGVPADALLETARWVRYGPSAPDGDVDPRAFVGLHALLENDEVTLLAVPDAVLPGWSLQTVAPPPPPDPPAPPPQPDWSRFLACSTHVPSAPVLSLAGRPDAVVEVSWSATDAPGASYELQWSGDPGFAAAEGLYLGPGLTIDVPRPPQGASRYLRVRALAGGLASAWSPGVAVAVAGGERWMLDDPVRYDPGALLAIQAAALRMSAARGDMLAMLALPEHYRAGEAIGHVEALARALGSADSPSLGFGALYHPWLYAAEPDDPTVVRRLAPDGAATGVAAQRASARGAWIAPANEPLADVLALDPPADPGDLQALLDAQVNVVRQEPAGFVVLAADTLTRDPELRPIGCRRLLALVRRTALRHGDATAFAGNDEQARRTIVRAFESLLGGMFALGAFAGASAREAFEVSTPVAPGDLDNGRLVVELRVAPARPLTFLTVRLVRSGSGGLTVEAR